MGGRSSCGVKMRKKKRLESWFFSLYKVKRQRPKAGRETGKRKIRRGGQNKVFGG